MAAQPPLLNKEQLSRLPDVRKHSVVFDWLTKVQDFLRVADPITVRNSQSELIKELDVLLSCNASPPVRRLTARAMASLFSKGNPFGAYQIINKCTDLIKTKEDPKEPAGQRLFALEVIGTLFQELGRLLGSCFVDAVTSLLTCLKTTESTRCGALIALGKLLSGLESSASMLHSRIYKAVKPYLGHSNWEVRSTAAECLAQLAKHYSALVVQSEFENLFSLATKQMVDQRRSKNFSILIANLSLSVLDHQVKISSDNKKDRKPTTEELLGYFRQSFTTGVCVQKRELFKQDISSPSVKSGIADAHVFLIRGLGSSWLETNSALFLGHVLGMAMEPRATQTHQDALYTCRQLKRILSLTVDQLLSEKAQLLTIKVLGQFISDHCGLPDVQTGHALSLACQAITSVTSILQSSSLPSLSDGSVTTSLMSTLCHELPMARLSAAWTLRQMALSQPSLHWSIFSSLVDRLAKFKSNRSAVEGHTSALAASLSSVGMSRHTVIERSNLEVILNTARDLLSSKSADSFISRSKFLGAWMLYCGVLSVPTDALSDGYVNEVVSAILSQATASFPSGDVKGAYLKEAKLDSVHQIRLIVESRSGALKALKILAEYHPKRIPQFSKSIERILRVALEFLSHTAKIVSTFGPAMTPVIHYYKMVLYSTLSASPRELWEHSLAELLKHLVSDITLADSNDLSISSLLSTLVDKQDLELLADGDMIVACQLPIGCLHHSASAIVTKAQEMPEPLPLQYQLMNEASLLFGQAFPISAIKHRAQIANHFIECLRQVRKDRQMFIQINILTAFSLALKELSRLKGTVGDEVVIKATAELFLSFVSHSSPLVKCVASSGLGRLAQLNPHLINNLAQLSFEKIKDPKSSEAAKSGFCLVLGDLHRFVGTRAKNSHIRTTGSILLSIANDARLGKIQTWATFALYLVVDAVGPNFTSFIEPTIDCVLDQLLSSGVSSQTVKCLSKLLQALITVVGPELASDQNSLSTIRATLAVLESTTAVQEAISCAQCLQMFVPDGWGNLARILPRLCEFLSNSMDTQLQSVAVGCLRQLAQRNPKEVSMLCEETYSNGIEEKLFELFEVPDGIALNEVRDTLNLLLSARFEEKTSFWISLVREVFQASHAAVNEKQAPAGDDSEDEDDEEKMTMNNGDMKEKPHWRTRVFAAEVLSNIMQHCVDSNHPAHFDLELCRLEKSDKSHFLVTHLSDLIRCFFIAATDSNTQLSIVGLTSLERLVDLFKASRDPDVEGSFLLEQYQANISAALRPAFSNDALPLVSVQASRVAAKWLSSGVASSTNDIQRVYRLMVSALDSIRYPTFAKSASSRMSRIKNSATIESWAEIFIAATDQASKPTDSACDRELPPDGMLNLVSVELVDLKKLWISDIKPQQCNSIVHAVSLLTSIECFWRDTDERDTVVQLVTGIVVETLLMPASSVSEESAYHGINALTKLHFNKVKDNVDVLRDLSRVAHRIIITRSGNDLLARALVLATKIISSNPKDQELRIFALETISCALSKTSDECLDLLGGLIEMMSDGADETEQHFLSFTLSSLLCRAVCLKKNGPDILSLLSTVKSFSPEIVSSIITKYCEIPTQNHTPSLSNNVAAFFVANYPLPNDQLRHLLKIFVLGLSKESSQVQTCSLLHSCFRRADQTLQKVIMNEAGSRLSRLIWENFLISEAIPDALKLFASFAEQDQTGQIIYIRLLFNLLQKQTRTAEVLQLFTQASTAYPTSVKRVLLSDSQLKMILEKRMFEQHASSSAPDHKDNEAPKIQLKMNFSNYAT